MLLIAELLRGDHDFQNGALVAHGTNFQSLERVVQFAITPNSRAAELAHLPLSERIPALVHSLSDAMHKCR